LYQHASIVRTLFETLIGQDNIAQTLKNSILRGQLAHAYLFCGPRGVGKTSTARIFAKTINCANPGPNMEPCGECESCESFAEGRSYCIHELDAASNNSVDDIRNLLEKVVVPPQVGKYSVYIIDEVHMLTQSAFNAFLKTLEEPPAHAIFILCTTEKHKIIPTILSRCQTYDFNRITIADMVRNLRGIATKEGINIDDESLHIIAQKADGAMRDALTIFDQTVAFCGTDIKYEDVVRNLGVLDYEYSFRLVDAFLAGDYATGLLIFDEVLNKGFNSLHFVSALSSHLRDLLVARTGGLESLLDLPDSLKARYRDQAARCSVKFLYDALGITSECEAGYKASSNQRLHIEYALMRLAFLSKVPSNEAVGTTPPSTVERSSTPPQTKSAVPPLNVPTAKAESEEQKPAAAPQRRSRAGHAGAAFAAMLNSDPEAAAAAAKPADAAPVDNLPSDEKMTAAWKELIPLSSAGKPRLAQAMQTAKISIRQVDDHKELDFEVVNEAQRRWLQDQILRDMERSYNKLLNSSLTRITISVQPEEEKPQKSYMPEEKAQDLMKKNSEVRELVVDLGLDAK